MEHIPFDTLTDFGGALLRAKGVAGQKADFIAEKAVETEACGITTHGLNVLVYLNSQIPDRFAPDTECEIVRELPGSVLIDANRGFSQIALKKGREIAVEKARKNGVAAAAIRNSCWLGALGIYLIELAEQGFCAQLWAQNSQCEDAAPIGGIDAKFSTNPVAMSFPVPGRPMMADMSTTIMSMGSANQLMQADERPSEKVFMDNEGHLTDDPSVMKNNGSMLFIGGANYGHKGYAFSLWCEALTAMAGGSCNNPEKDQSQTLVLFLLDISAFAGDDYYSAEMERFIAHMKDNRLRPGFDEIRLPGERALSSLEQSKKQGVPVSDEKIKKLNTIAGENGLEKIC